jgi:hypothetical protein
MRKSERPILRLAAIATATLVWSALLALPAIGQAAEATVTVSPGSQTYGSQVIGHGSGQQTFEIRGEGPEAVLVSSVALAGTDPADFSIEANGCSGQTLGPGGNCLVSLRFTPTAAGPREAVLEVGHDGEGSPSTATMSGTGLRQELTLSPSPLTFPVTTTGMTSEREVMVENHGDVAAQIFGTNFEGPGSGSFATNGSSCGPSLGVGESCKIEIRYSAGSVGEDRASLHLSAEGPGGGPTVELLGTSATAQLRFEPESFDFGLTQTNEGGSSTQMVLRNAGPAATQVGIETGGGNGAFSIGNSDCFGTTLQPNGTCSVQIQFRPNQTGLFVGSLRANSAGQIFSAELRGEGGQAVITATPTPVDLGSATVGTEGETRTVTLTNTGNLPGGFFIAVVSGGDSASFRLIEEDCTGVPLGPGASCHAVVNFAPTAVGLRRATLSFFGDGEGGQQIPLLGTGTAPGQVALSPTAHNFGAQTLGTSGPTQLFTFTNETGSQTPIDAVTLVGGDPDQFRISHDSCLEGALASGASCQVGVRFAPDSAGAKSAVLRLSGAAGVLTAALAGVGQEASAQQGAATKAPRARVDLQLAGRPLHLRGSSIGVGRFGCSSDSACRIQVDATVVTVDQGGAGRTSSLPAVSVKVAPGKKGALSLVVAASTRRALVRSGGQLRLTWKWTSGTDTGSGRAAVSVR